MDFKYKLNQIRGRCKSDPFYKNRIKCFLSEDDLRKLWIYFKGDTMKRPNLDRINGLGHYTLDNCQFLECEAHLSKDQAVRVALLRPKNRCGYCGMPCRKKYCTPEHYRAWQKRLTAIKAI